MSFCAKKASTTTIRMGKAALLKNLLMRGARGTFASYARDWSGYQGGLGLPEGGTHLVGRWMPGLKPGAQPAGMLSSVNAATYGRVRERSAGARPWPMADLLGCLE